MKKNILMLVAAFVSSAFTGACTAPTADSAEEINETESELRVMNGDQMSGVALSGSIVNGALLDSVTLTGMEIGGLAISNVSLDGTILTGNLPNGTQITALDFIGATMQGVLTDGTTVSLVIDDIVESGDADILHYAISHVSSRGGAKPVCGLNESGDAIMSFPLTGRYDQTVGTATGGSFIADASRFSLACRGAALAKCAELGYKPFRDATECNASGACQTVSMQPLHQACVRMVRADYCGDGASHTQNGTEIDVFDTFKIKGEDPSVMGSLEAEWGVDGAQCVVHTRWVNGAFGNVQQYMQDHCPGRYNPQSPVCGKAGSSFNTEVGYAMSLDDRALLRNRSEVHQ